MHLKATDREPMSAGRALTLTWRLELAHRIGLAIIIDKHLSDENSLMYCRLVVRDDPRAHPLDPDALELIRSNLTRFALAASLSYRIIEIDEPEDTVRLDEWRELAPGQSILITEKDCRVTARMSDDAGEAAYGVSTP